METEDTTERPSMNSTNKTCNSCCGKEIIDSFKQGYIGSETKYEKYEILTSLPKCCTIDFMEKEFGCKIYMARKATYLRSTRGTFTRPPKQIGRSLSAIEIAIPNGEDDSDDETQIPN